jgi:hypothetical protein
VIAINKNQILLGPAYGLAPTQILSQNAYLSNPNLLSDTKITPHATNLKEQIQANGVIA